MFSRVRGCTVRYRYRCLVFADIDQHARRDHCLGGAFGTIHQRTGRTDIAVPERGVCVQLQIFFRLDLGRFANIHIRVIQLHRRRHRHSKIKIIVPFCFGLHRCHARCIRLLDRSPILSQLIHFDFRGRVIGNILGIGQTRLKPVTKLILTQIDCFAGQDFCQIK